MKSSSTLVVVVGAGASFDCALPDSTAIDDYRPPLAADLFHPKFKEILKRFPGAERCSAEIRQLMRGSISLEQALKTLQDDPKGHIRRNFRWVPLYLRELIGETQQRFISHGSNAFNRLVDEIFRVVPEIFETVLFLTLNYDTYLEHALMAGVSEKSFGEASDYVQPNARFALIKLHGSVTWLHSMDTSQYERVMGGAEIPRPDRMSIVPSYNVQPPGSLKGYPALAIPVEGKAAFYCPAILCDTAARWLADATDLLVIGCSLIDPDIVNFLGSIQRVNRFKIVNGSAVAGDDACARLAAHDVFRVLPGGSMPAFDGGFSKFVTEGALGNFLRD